ncbi:MAG TPA: putative 2-aminoethylphosphonate ABC transporter permease subunit, partial [Methylomirabilota bacterium]|nr:putative 2-aminoethylphosphonate ABC transporter permease subunit [Methylomirabilota bacterium]
MSQVAAAPDAVRAAPAIRPQVGRDEWIMRGAMIVIGLGLVVTLALPLGVMLAKSFQNTKGEAVGLANYVQYFATPALARSIGNSFSVSILSTLITVPLAFVYAYALTRSCAPGRALFKTIALIPILVPSLLPGIALVYL